MTPPTRPHQPDAARPGPTRSGLRGRTRRAAAAGAALALLLSVPMTGTAAAANDERFGDQWGLQRVGAEHAWRAATGEGVMIAVVDTGVDFSHPDLVSRVVSGTDILAGDGDARDETGHGTLVAGIAAAAANNGIGIAGVAPKAQVLPVRVLAQDGSGRAADAADGIRWAVDNARAAGHRLVVNLSLDWEPIATLGVNRDGTMGSVFEQDARIDEAIRYASANGAFVAVASGNQGLGEVPYDATVPGVLVVGSTNRADTRSSFSNYGQGLDVVAPGEEIMSTYWTASGGSSYGLAKGTSVAVPFVSGTAALLMSQGLSNAQAAARITATARDLGPVGLDAQYGAGLVDAAAALGVPRTAAAAPPAAPAPPAKRKPAAAKPPAAPAPSPAPSPSPSPAAPPPPPAPSPSPSPAAPPVPPTPLVAELAAQHAPQVPGSPVAPPLGLAAVLIAMVLGLHAARVLARRRGPASA